MKGQVGKTLCFQEEPGFDDCVFVLVCLQQWFSICSPHGVQGLSKGSAEDDYGQLKVCEYLLLQFKGVHTYTQSFQRDPQMKKKVANHWSKGTSRTQA